MTTTSLRARPSHVPPVSTASSFDDEDLMGKSDVPILEIRPFNGGLRRFAVKSIEPFATASEFSRDRGNERVLKVSAQFWERIEDRGVVVKITDSDGSRTGYVGTGMTAEAALHAAWKQLNSDSDFAFVLPVEILALARDYDVTVNEPDVE